MADKIWVGTTDDYATAGNWSPSGVPGAADNVRIPAGSGNIGSGLDQSAVAIGDFIVEEGYTGTIGTSAAYLEIDPDRFEFAGTGLAYIDIGAAAIPPLVKKTATAQIGLRGLYLIGSGITVLTVQGGKVGLASRPFESTTAATVRVTGSNADVWIGAGASITSVELLSGAVDLRAAATNVRVYGGTLRTSEEGAITTVTVEGGTVYLESIGTVGTLNAYGGLIDLTKSGAARTISALKLGPTTVVKYDPDAVTVSAFSAPDEPVTLSVTAGV